MIYYFPQNLAGNYANHVWLKIIPLKVNSQTGASRGESSLDTDSSGLEFNFLINESFKTQITHQWQDYQGIAARLEELMSTVYGAAEVLGAVGNMAANVVKSDYTSPQGSMADKIKSSGDQVLNKAYQGLKNAPILYRKVDVPQIWKGTEFRVFDITLNLGPQNENEARNMIKALKTLEYLSLAGADGEIGFKPPDVFEIKTFPLPVLHFSRAALVSVNYDYFGPYYKNGYPNHIDVNFQFKDLLPAYRNTNEGIAANKRVIIGDVNE